MRAVAKEFADEVPVSEMRGSVEYAMATETDWPKLRPYRAHTRETVVVSVGDRTAQRVEDHVFEFDWAGSAQAQPKCD